jgi:phosphatidylglycerol:prolipoprotein diacylglycerol transferase
MPVLFHLPGDLPVYLSSLLVGLGATLGMALIAWRSPVEDKVRLLDQGLLVLLGTLIGGRLTFVLLNWSYFQLNLAEIPLLYLGGFSWVGALLGGILILAIISVISRQPFASLVDGFFPLLGILAVCGWLACWLDGCAYGELSEAWWGLPANDEWGVIANRTPTQLLGALSALSLTVLSSSGLSQRLPPGILAGLGLIGLSLVTLVLSLIRADPDPRWHGLRFDTWTALVFLAICVIIILAIAIAWIRRNTNGTE